MSLPDALPAEQITTLLGTLDQAVRDHDQSGRLMTMAEQQEVGRYYLAMKAAEQCYNEAWQKLINADVQIAFDRIIRRHVQICTENPLRVCQ